MAIPSLSDYLNLPTAAAGARVAPTLQSLTAPVPRQPAVPSLTPEEEDSLLAQLGHGTLSTLGYIGGVLDKTFGGRAIRGILGGEPRELLSIIPGSDTLGITRPEDVVSGSDLVENLGLQQRPGEMDWADVLGFGAEVALDPATYLTLGTSAALGKAGKIVEAAGMLPKTRAGRIAETFSDVVARATPEEFLKLRKAAGTARLTPAQWGDESLAGLARVGLPFGIGPQKVIGTGDLAQQFAGKLDDLAEAAKFSKLGRIAGGLFDHERADVLSEGGQKARTAQVQENVQNTYKSGKDVVDVASDLDPLEKMVKTGSMSGDAADSVFRRAVEKVPIPASELDPASDAAKGVASAADKTRKLFEEVHAEAKASGRAIGTLEDLHADFSHRSSTVAKKGFKAWADKLFSFEGDNAAKPRNIILTQIPGGTETVNKWTSDLGMTGAKRQLADDQVLDAIITDLGKSPEMIQEMLDRSSRLKAAVDAGDDFTAASILDELGQVSPNKPASVPVFITNAMRKQLSEMGYTIDQIRSMTPDQAWMIIDPNARNFQAGDTLHLAKQVADDLYDEAMQPERISKWLKNLPEEIAGKRLYGDALRDVQQYIKREREANTAAKVFTDFVADPSHVAHANTVGGDDYVSLLNVFKKAGAFGEGELTDEAINNILSRVAGKGFANADELKHAMVPSHIAADAHRFINGFLPHADALKPVIEAADAATQMFRTGVTVPWPGFNVRNFVTGLWMGYVGGAFDPSVKGPMRYIKPWMEQRDLLAGRVIKGAADKPIFRGMGLTDAQATRKLAEMQFAYGLTTDSILRDVAGPLVDKPPGTMSSVLDAIPGRTPRHPIKDYVKALDPRGKSVKEVLYSPIAAGQELTNNVENMNRGSMFMAFVSQGMDPVVAATKSKRLNVNYAEATGTGFQRQVARRAIPFYSYVRGMLPVQLEELASHPGGPIRQAIRLTESNRDESGFAPPYLKGKLAVPLGGEREDGTQRYLTQLDLPHEMLNDIGTGAGVLGMMNPFPKGVLETLTGRSFFSGRDLRDLDPRSGRVLQNLGIIDEADSVPPMADTLLSMTPAARLLTSIGTAVDPRKGPLAKATNLLTGFRLSDVDMPKQRQIAARELITENLRGRPGIGTYERTYASEPERLSPRDWMMLRLLETDRRRQQQLRRMEKAAAAAKPSLVEALQKQPE